MNIAELVDGGNFEVIPGKHDKSKLVIHENVAYKVGKVTQKEGSKIYYLKCKFGSCPSRAQIRGGFLSLSPSFKAHTCSSEGASQSTWSALEAIAKMKVRAMKETSTPLSIYNEVMMGLPENAKAKLPYERCKKAIKDARNRSIPTCPPTLHEVIPKLEAGEYPEMYQKQYLGSVHWDQKIQGRSEKVRQSAIILGDAELFNKVIREATFYFADGTFKVTCRQARVLSLRSSQVFDILADFNGTAICIMTIVMTCRKFALYRTVFQKIRELFPSFLPQYLMVDFEAAVRKAVHRVWPETRIVGCRFHYSKCLFSKLKSKFRLASFFRPNGSDVQRDISTVLRQYFALPLIRHRHMRGEVMRMERELRQLALKCRGDVASRLNKFHNYVVAYWLKHQGASTISVCGSPHKTNNICERFNGMMQAEMPTHPSLFMFMNRLQSSVISNGLAIVAQSQSGRVKLRKQNDRVREALLEKAKHLEREYLEGLKTATDVLRAAACHYDDDKVVEVFSAFADSLEVQEVNQGPNMDEEGGLLNVFGDSLPSEMMDVDEIEKELALDEDLKELPAEDDWVEVTWPIEMDAPLSRTSSVGREENIDDVACITCPYCYVHLSNMKVFSNCDHIICSTCYSQVKACPVCRKPKGNGDAKTVNISNLVIVRKDEAENDFGLSTQVRNASTTTSRRPADETDAEIEERRNREAIAEALREDGQDPDVVLGSQPSGSGGGRARGRGGRQSRGRGGRGRRPRRSNAEVRNRTTRSERSDRSQDTQMSFISFNGESSGEDFV